MSAFRTTFQIEPLSSRVSYQESIFFIGSCFTEHIGQKLIDLKYKVLQNPFGILYNPVSILNTIERIEKNIAFSEEDLVERDGLYHSFHHHGRFSDTNKERSLKKINAELDCASHALKDVRWLVITWGTSSVFQLTESSEVVANCHKFPADHFQRKQLSLAEIVDSYRDLLDRLKKTHPELQVIFTVSPVRHWKDGAVQNQRNKARLILAAEQLSSEFSQVHYFPSYELQMDDLRDYRFYKKDMLHPSDEAIDYIWNAFSDYSLDSQEKSLRQKVSKIKQGLNHRPLYKRRKEHSLFLENLLTQIKEVEATSDSIDFSNEKEKINERLDHF